MSPRLLLAFGLFAALAASARAGYSFNWSAPSSVNVNEGYTVSVEVYFAPSDYEDPYAVLSLSRNGSQVGGGSTGPYGWASASNSFNDSTPQTVTYGADAYSYHGETDYSSHYVTVNGAPANQAPTAWVTVDGQGHGATVTRPYGGSATVTVRYKASDSDGNLSGIRPQIWYPNGSLNNNGGAFVGQSGGYGEVAWSVTLDQDGDWYFWTDAQDSVIAPSYVDSGSWGSGFRLTVVQGSPPNTPPSVTLLAPGAQTIASGTNLTLTSQATDPDGNLAEHNLDIQRPDGNWNWYGGFAYGEPYMGGPVGSAANSTRSAGFTFDQTGTWYVRSYGRDSAGASVHSAIVAITVVQANQAPTGTVRVNTTSITVGQQVVVSVDATDANGNLHYINIDQTSPTNGFYGPGDTGTETPPNNGAYDLGGYFGSRTRDLTLTLNTPGTYVFRGAMNDDSGWYYTPNTVSVSVGNAGQGAVSISPSSQGLALGQSVTFTASGGSGSGDYVWGGDASGTGSSKSVTFNTAGSRTVTVYRAASAGYNQSNTASASISVDGSPPGAPQNLQISGLSSSGFTVSWSAPSGEAAAGYRVRLDSGSSIDVGGALSHSFSGLAANTSYAAQVSARDAAGNWSDWAGAGATTGSAGGGGTQAEGSVWRDIIGGDGILDEIVRAGTWEFNYYVNEWYTTNYNYAYLPINNYWQWWSIFWEPSVYEENFTSSWEFSDQFWVSYDAYFELAFEIGVSYNQPFRIYRDRSSSEQINLGDWELLINTVGSPGGFTLVNYLLQDPAELPGAQYFMVKEGLPVGRVEIRDSAGNVLESDVGAGETATVNLPSNGELMIPVYDDLGQEMPIETGGHGLTWIVEKVVDGVTHTINGIGKLIDVSPILPLPNGQILVKLKLDNSDQYFTFILVLPNAPAASPLAFVKDGGNDLTVDSSDPVISFARIGHWGADRLDGGVSGYEEGLLGLPLHGIVLNFINEDPERFYVRLVAPDRNTDPNAIDEISSDIQIGSKLQSGAQDDDMTPLRLRETGNNTGVFVSESQMLMSEDIGDADDDYSWPGTIPEDDQPNDRTHRASVDGTVIAVYQHAGQSITVTIPVSDRDPDERRTLNVVVTNFREPWQDTNGNGVYDAGEPFVDISNGGTTFETVGTWGEIWTSAEIETQLTGLRIALATARIRLSVVGNNTRNPVGNLFAQTGTTGGGTFIGRFDANSDDFTGAAVSRDHAIIQANFRHPQQFNGDDLDDVLDIYFLPPFMTNVAGVSYDPGYIAAVNNPSGLPQEMSNQVFVSLRAARDNMPFILGHETYHQLTNLDDPPANTPTPGHIMFPSTGTAPGGGSTPHYDRRIQEDTALKARTVRSAADFVAVGNRLLRTP